MDPLKEYSARRDRRLAEELLLKRQFINLGNWRLVLGVITAALAWLSFGIHKVSPYVLLLPVTAFIALVVWHQRVIRARVVATRALAYYSNAFSRVQDRWMGTGSTGDQFRNDQHVYANDLDVFGKGSVFELISVARTGPGE